MTRTRTGALALAGLLFVAAACGSKDESTDSSPPAETAATEAETESTEAETESTETESTETESTETESTEAEVESTEAPAETGPPEIEDSTSGVSDTEIRIGIHAPESVGGIDLGDILGLGDMTTLYWDTVNVNGGINGRQVVVDLQDDGYSADMALQACRDLVANGVLFISGLGGADQVITCADRASKDNIPYMSLGVSEAGLIGVPGYRSMTMTYDGMAPLMAEYIVGEIADAETPVAMVRFNSPSSEGMQNTFEERMNELGGNVVALDAVDKQGNVNEMTAECVKLQQAGAEIVFTILVPTVSKQFADLCAEQNYTPQFTTTANTLTCATGSIGTPNLIGCQAFAGTVTDNADVPLAIEAQEAWAAAYPDREAPERLAVFWGLFDAYREALELAGPEPTTLGFLDALDGMQYDNGLFNPIDFKGTQIGSDVILVTEAIGEYPYNVEILSEWTSSFID